MDGGLSGHHGTYCASLSAIVPQLTVTTARSSHGFSHSRLASFDLCLLSPLFAPPAVPVPSNLPLLTIFSLADVGHPEF